MHNFLQGLLNTKAARVRKTSGAEIIMVFPRRKTAMRQATHAIRLILADHLGFFRCREDQRVIGRFKSHGKTKPVPGTSTQQVITRNPEILALHPDIQLMRMLTRLLGRIGNLAFRTRFEAAEKFIANSRGIKTGRREFMQQHIAFLDLDQFILPTVRDRTFLRQQRPCSELKSNLAKLFIINPVLPVFQGPYTASHNDWHVVRYAFSTHSVAYRFYTRIGIFGFARIFGIAEAIMPASQPRIFINHRRHKVGHFAIGPLPQGTKSTGGTDNRQIANTVLLGNFRQLIGHARAAGNTGHHAFCLFQHAFQYTLCAAHFPQDVDVDRAFAIGNLERTFDLRHRAINSILDKLFMALAASLAMIDLRDNIAIFVVAVRINSRNSTDTAGGSPRTRTCMIGCSDTFATLDQRPNFTAIILDWLNPFEHYILLYASCGPYRHRSAKLCEKICKYRNYFCP